MLIGANRRVVKDPSTVEYIGTKAIAENGGMKVMRVPILMYHSISHTAHPRFARFVISREAFAQQMQYLATHDYTPLTVSQYIAARRDSDIGLGTRPVVITFDDGFADFVTDALPVLIRHGFVATLYVTTGYINGTSRWLGREGEAMRPMLSWEQLGTVAAHGVECGAHTHTHPPLDTLPLTAARKEIVRSKREMEERLGRSVESFAYPFGYYSTAVRRLVWESGFTSACAVNYASSGATDDPFTLSRLIVTPAMTLDTFAHVISGCRAGRPRSLVRAQAALWRSARRISTVWRRLPRHEYEEAIA